MDLISIKIHGYKRFEQPSMMNVDGKIVALVGPNEAGKSSFLKALLHLNHHDDFIRSGSSQELTRGATVPDEQGIIEAKYLLDDLDRNAISHIQGAEGIRWFLVEKRVKGNTFYITLIPSPKRDLSLREKAVKALKNLLSVAHLSELDSNEEKEFSKSEIKALINTLNQTDQTLSKKVIQRISTAAKIIQDEVIGFNPDYIDPDFLLNLPQELSELAEYEGKEHPSAAARHILFKRRPQFLFFDEEQRSLQSEYALDTLGENPPIALKNLARLAGLSLQALRDALAEKDFGKVETLEEQANLRLKQVFLDSWSQSGVTVRFRIDSM